MKLYIDDIRKQPKTWTLAQTISEAVNLIEHYGDSITHISFDHDISIPVKVKGEWYNRPSPDTFQVVAKYCKQYYKDTHPIYTTHSSNPDGRRTIVNILGECTETPAEQAFRKHET